MCKAHGRKGFYCFLLLGPSSSSFFFFNINILYHHGDSANYLWDCHLHVTLPTAKPDVSKQDIMNAEGQVPSPEGLLCQDFIGSTSLHRVQYHHLGIRVCWNTVTRLQGISQLIKRKLKSNPVRHRTHLQPFPASVIDWTQSCNNWPNFRQANTNNSSGTSILYLCPSLLTFNWGICKRNTLATYTPKWGETKIQRN